MQTKLDPKTKEFLYQKLIYDFAPYLNKEPKDTSLEEVLLWLYSIAPTYLLQAVSYNEFAKKEKGGLKLQGILKDAAIKEKDLDEAIDWFNKSAEKVTDEI